MNMNPGQKQKNIYCFDTSAFLTLSRTSENVLKIPDALWEYLEKMMQDGRIVSHRIVFDEIISGAKNPNFITQWVSTKKDHFLSKTDEQKEELPKIVQKYPELIDYKRESEQADPWLIALAIEKSKTSNLFEVCVAVVVSQENPNSSKKIPAACKCFGIRPLSLRNFFDEIGLSTELIKKSKVKLGKIYQLGNHRIMCGDATKEEDVKKLMGGKQADMVWTDAPYNMNYKSKKKGGILNDNMAEEKFVEFSEQFVARIKENLKSGGAFYMCSGYSSYIPFIYAIKSNNLEFANPIIWVKNNLGMGMNDYRHSHEMILKGKGNKKSAQPILYGWNEGKHYFVDVHDEADVWEIKKRATNTMVHPNQKPIELISRAIRNSSKRDQIVLDLFGGSFSTLISCEKEGRIFYGMDLDPKYVEIGIKRWQKLTGITDPPMV
jgi:site-specific DNA-methyltransferase (adenine-specific)